MALPLSIDELNALSVILKQLGSGAALIPYTNDGRHWCIQIAKSTGCPPAEKGSSPMEMWKDLRFLLVFQSVLVVIAFVTAIVTTLRKGNMIKGARKAPSREVNKSHFVVRKLSSRR